MAAHTHLKEQSVDDLASLLDKQLANQWLNILNIIATLMGINREAIKNKSKRTVKKLKEKAYGDILSDADKKWWW